MLRLSILTFTMEMVLKTLSGSTAPGSKITNLKSWQQITAKEDSLRLFRRTKQHQSAMSVFMISNPSLVRMAIF
jgi:hypothetical protein